MAAVSFALRKCYQTSRAILWRSTRGKATSRKRSTWHWKNWKSGLTSTGAGIFSLAFTSDVSLAHVTLCANLITTVCNSLRDAPYHSGGSQLKVKLEAAGAIVYPDFLVYHAGAQFYDKYPDALLEPIVVVEVLSPESEVTDRGWKLESYLATASLTDYLLVAQNRVSIEHYTRQDGGNWLYRHYTQRDQSIRLARLDIEFPVADLYYRLKVPEGLCLIPATEPEA